MTPAKKRGSPGAEATKNGITSNREVEISSEDSLKLSEIAKEMATAELVLGMRREESLCLHS